MSPNRIPLRAIARTAVVGLAATSALGVGTGAALAAPAAKTVHLAAKVAPTGHPHAGGSASLNLGATLPKGDTLKRYTISYGDKSKPVTVTLSKKVHFPKTVKHTYGRAGRYTVTLTLTDVHNHTSKVTTHALILAAATSGGSAATGTTGSTGTPGNPAPSPTPVRTFPTLGWGANGSGQLGDGSLSTRTTPVTVGLDKITSISSGTATTYAVAGGVVYAWGDDQYGQLGTSAPVTGCQCSRTPVAVSGLTGTFTAVAAAANSVYALRIDGTVWTWGSNALGELGTGATSTTGCLCDATPQQMTIQDVKALAAGAGTGYALKTDGTVWAWGANDVDQVGSGSTAPKTPTAVAVPVKSLLILEPFDAAARAHAIPVNPITGRHTTVTQIAAGGTTGYALRSDGTVWSWGNNLAGQLGVGTHGGAGSVSEVLYPGGVTNYVTNAAGVYAGGGSAYLVTDTGDVYMWGDNSSGQLGTTPDAVASNVLEWNPRLNLNLGGTATMAIGAATAYALTTHGAVEAFGKGASGQLGDGSTTDRLGEVSGLTGPPMIASGSTSSSAFAILSVP